MHIHEMRNIPDTIRHNVGHVEKKKSTEVSGRQILEVPQYQVRNLDTTALSSQFGRIFLTKDL